MGTNVVRAPGSLRKNDRAIAFFLRFSLRYFQNIWNVVPGMGSLFAINKVHRPTPSGHLGHGYHPCPVAPGSVGLCVPLPLPAEKQRNRSGQRDHSRRVTVAARIAAVASARTGTIAGSGLCAAERSAGAKLICATAVSWGLNRSRSRGEATTYTE